jgi:cytoskeleton protein RodZ
VGSFGEKLRRERELRAVTLDEIAEATKIGSRSLKALEDEQFDILPGGIFNKGFVRAYAKYLGIDEEQAVADYMAAIGESAAKPGPVSEDVIASIAKKRSEPERKIDPEEKTSSKLWVVLAVVALIAAGSYSSWKYIQQRKIQKQADFEALKAAAQPGVSLPGEFATPVKDVTPQAVVPAPQTTTPQPRTAQPATTATPAATPPAQSKTQPPTATVPGEFAIKLHATEGAWVSIQADGKTVIEELLSANYERTITAKDKIVIKVGKPGALEVSFNGKPVGPLGPSDKTVTRTFTSEGLVTQ